MRFQEVQARINIFLLSGLALFLPLSEYGVSVFIILHSVYWLVQLVAGKLNNLSGDRKFHLIFLVVFLLYIIWLPGTDNPGAGLASVRLKLPMFAIPIILITIPGFTRKESNIIIYAFILGVLIATVAGYVNWILNPSGLTDRREMSLFISHIRLSLMIIMALTFLVYTARDSVSDSLIRISFIIFLWLLFYLVISFSFTGIVIGSLVVVFFAAQFLIYRKSKILSLLFFFGAAIILCMVYLTLRKEYKSLFPDRGYVDIEYDLLSSSGNEYTHFPDRMDKENGYLVWRYICFDELRAEWNKLSDFDFDLNDKKGHQIQNTIIRYMTSLGLKKDSAGISFLQRNDIDMIQNGYASLFYKESGFIRIRLYELFWQIDYYKLGGSPQGHSITQRLEYMKTTTDVISQNLLFGTDPGDFVDKLKDQYRVNNTLLDPEFRYSSHNQYLRSVATFGITGALIFWIGILFPALRHSRSRSVLFKVFLLVSLTSMLWEDTLETHTGVSFFAFFYFLLILYPIDKNTHDS